MLKSLIFRHAESYANKRNYTAFGNEESPLTEKGIEQTKGIISFLDTEFGIFPSKYNRTVAASEFTRTLETAQHTGFKNIARLAILNEADVTDEIVQGINVVEKHAKELWVPESAKHQAKKFVGQLIDGSFNHEIAFSHGMFMAAVTLECIEQKIEVVNPRTEERGFIPLQTRAIEIYA